MTCRFIIVAGCAFGAVLAAMASLPAPFTLTLSTTGDVSLGRGGGTLGLRIYKEGWTGAIMGEPIIDGGAGLPSKQAVHFRLKNDFGATCIEGRVTLLPGHGWMTNGIVPGVKSLSDLQTTAYFALHATAIAEIRAECVAMEFAIPARDVVGLEWRAGDVACGVFPEHYGESRLWRGMADSFTYIDSVTRKPMGLRFPRPMPLLLQDSRIWGSNFSVRIELPKNMDIAFECEIFHPNGVTTERDEIVVIKPGDDWIPLDNRKNIIAGSALDFSFLSDAPAGKYGWLKAVGGHFEFADNPGVAQRFVGVNLCDTANFPSHYMADELVARLKRLGYNSIRFHHHDSAWADKTDCFDYLAAAAMRKGIYLTTDLYVSRKVAWRDIGFDRDGFVPNNVFKSLVALHEPAFENWKTFASAFLLHENPYMGRRYIDEPGIPLLCLVNEGPMKWAWNGIKKMDCVKEKWEEWRRGRKCSQIANVNSSPEGGSHVENHAQSDIPPDPSSIANFEESAAAQCFAAEMERRAFVREKAFLISIGCKALLTSQNCTDDQAMASLRETFDYVDNHCYLDHPRFLGKLWSGAFRLDPGGNPVKVESGPLANAAFTRIAGKPYTLTEWNLPGPGRYRGAGGFLMGAMAARQNWAGLWRFAYSHVERGLADGYGAPHLFDLSVDPVNQASERAVMCLFLRGDMAPLEAKVALDVGAPRLTPDGKPAANRPEWMDEAWRIQVGRATAATNLEARMECYGIGCTSVCGRVEHADCVEVPPCSSCSTRPDISFANFAANNNAWCSFPLDAVLSAPPVISEERSDFVIDREAGSVCIATPRTCGIFAEGGVHKAGALSVEILEASVTPRLSDESGAASVWVSSLDGEPLKTSSRILVMHLTDAQAEGNVFADRARSILLKWGKGKTLVRNDSACVSLSLCKPSGYVVHALDTAGRRVGTLPATALDGVLSFEVSTRGQADGRIYYEVERKQRGNAPD